MSKLKNLYKNLIDNKKSEFDNWHHNFYEFFDDVRQMRERIKAGDGLSPEKDECFLWRLLGKKSNGIADGGQSNLEDEKFQLFIRNADFISSLEQLILDPCKDNYRKFGEIWTKQARSAGFRRNPLLVNRVAAACTHKVSTTVFENAFNQVFDWLINKKIIPKYYKESDWFSKNIFLMEIINTEFKNEIQNKTTDEFYLRHFVWELQLHKASNNVLTLSDLATSNNSAILRKRNTIEKLLHFAKISWRFIRYGK